MVVRALGIFGNVDDVRGSAEVRPLSPVMIEWKSQPLGGAHDVQPVADPSNREAISYECALVVVDAGGQRVAEVDVTLTQRIIAGRRSRLTGTDRSGSLRVRLEANLPSNALRSNLQFRPGPTATPGDLLPALELFEALDQNRRLGLWSLVTQHWVAEPVPIPADHPRLPAGYSSTVRVLGRVQRRSGQRFAMPVEITQQDASNIRRADALLGGAVLTGRWQHAYLVIDTDGMSLIRSATDEHGALVEFTSDYAVEIAGNTVILGAAEHRLLQARLANAETGGADDEVVVELVPGGDDRYELRLVAVDAPGEAGGLEDYAGQWIAQVGSEVVAAGETPEEVIGALARSGRTAAVWRVPRSRAEAEALNSPS